MARDKALQQNIDGSDLVNYPNKRIRNNDGSGNGTPVNEQVYGDIHEYFAKTMREAKLNYNGLPDNTSNGYQYFEAFTQLPNKNDFIKNISLLAPDTASVPIRISALQIDETIEFRSTFNSSNAVTLIKGVDNSVKNVTILGSWKTGDIVRVINLANSVSIVGLYDSQNVPNLVTLISNIQQTFANWTKIMSVFQVNGAMLFWNKPANEIPAGWQEVVNWRGRIPVGFDDAQIEFNQMGKTGGAKKRKILKENLPAEGIKLYPSKSTSGAWKTSSGSGRPLLDIHGGPFSNPWGYTEERETAPLGNGLDFDLLNPYRVVMFIEYVG